MKTQEEQMAFAEENQRLTKRFGEIADAMEALTLPEDTDRFRELLNERFIVIDSLHRLTDEYMTK